MKLFGKKGEVEGIEIKEKPDVEFLSEMAKARYVYCLDAVKHSPKLMSAREITRALIRAIDMGMDTYPEKIEFQTENEAQLAGLIAQILDFRTIIQGQKMRESEAKAAEPTNTETKPEIKEEI